MNNAMHGLTGISPPFRRFWSAHVDALERHLDRMEQVAPRKGKKR